MKVSERKRLCAYMGDPCAVFGIKEYRFDEGRADGMKAIDIGNGQGLEMTILSGRCLDIPYLSFKGINIGFLSKVGLSSPAYYQEDGTRGFLRQFQAGFLTTCGLTYSGAPCEENGQKYGLHGPIGNTPAEYVKKEVREEEGQYVISVSGRMYQACVFEENLCLEREIKLETETNRFHIFDKVTNRGFREEPLMNVYHMNFGYPMLEESCRVYFGTSHMEPRDETARNGIKLYDRIEEPQADYKEQCFFHTSDEPRKTFVMLHNPKRKLAVVIHYDTKECPILCEWKNMMSGDYALGLEPTASGVLGRKGARDANCLQFIKPEEIKTFTFTVEFLEADEEIALYKEQAEHYRKVE